MEVVLASGQIVNANQRSNPDLFAALKGGSNNFGVVTRFDLMSFAQDNLWGGTIAYPGSADAHQLQAFAKFMDPANFDPFAEIEQSFLYYGATNASQSVNDMYYTKPVVDPPALQGFAAVQPQLANTMRLSKMRNLTEEIESEQPVNQQFDIRAPACFDCMQLTQTQVHLCHDRIPLLGFVSRPRTRAVEIFRHVPIAGKRHGLCAHLSEITRNGCWEQHGTG